MKTETKKNKPRKPAVGVGRPGPAQDSFAIDAGSMLPEEHASAQLVDDPADASESGLRVSSEPCLFSTVGVFHSTAYIQSRDACTSNIHVNLQFCVKRWKQR